MIKGLVFIGLLFFTAFMPLSSVPNCEIETQNNVDCVEMSGIAG